MSRYIDKDLLLEKINKFMNYDQQYTEYNCGYDDCICAVQDTIGDMPEVDVVEVVRCKECKHWDNGDCWRIELTKPDDYCSYGERK